jgi:hypothetical protein
MDDMMKHMRFSSVFGITMERQVDRELHEIKDSIQSVGAMTPHKSTSAVSSILTMMRDMGTRRSLIVGCSLVVLQQWCMQH